MTEYVRSTVSSIGGINTELTKIKTALDDKIGRKSSGPRIMEADLDLNGNQLLNIPTPKNPTDAVRFQDLLDYASENVDDSLRADLANVNSTVPIAGFQANVVGGLFTDFVNVMQFIPSNLWTAIRNHTNTVDLTSYMNAAHATGKIVAYPAGKFKFSKLTIPSGGIVGEYKNTILDSFDTSSDHLITHQGLDDKGLLVNERGAYFRDFYLRVGSMSQKASGAGIFINSGASNENYTSYIGGVTIRNVPSCVRTTNASYLTIERNYFSFFKENGVYVDNDYAAFGDNGDNIINGNSFYTTASAFAIKYRTGGGRIVSNKINGGLIGVDISPLRDSSIVLVQGNSIENQTINAVRFVTEAGASATDFTQVMIQGNQIGGYNLLGNAIQINPTTYSLKNLKIDGNYILSPTVDTNAIDVRNVDRFTISNNLIDCSGSGYGGIFVSATAANGLVSDNEVHRYTTNHTQILSASTKESRKVTTVSTAYTVPLITNGTQHTLDITVNGATFGDNVNVSMNVSNAGLILTGYVLSANTVRISWFNPTGASVTLGAVTVKTNVSK